MTKSIIDRLAGAGNDKNQGGSLGITEDQAKCLNYRTATTMLNQLLTCDREILVPTRVAGYTVVELARALEVLPEEIRWFKKAYWRKVRSRIALKLVTLYLNTKFYEN